MVNLTESLNPQELRAEVAHLQEEVKMRDQLVQQLSQELFRLVKSSGEATTPAATTQGQSEQLQLLHAQLAEVEQQVDFYQQQIAERDRELVQQRQTVQELNDRARMLEQVVQELPEIYKQKFAERLKPVQERVEMLQRENRQLHSELQSVSYRLAQRSRRQSGNLDLPNFEESQHQASLPSFGSA